MFSAIILAAGSGSRLDLGYNKILYKLNDRTIIEETVSKFIKADFFKEIIVVIKEEEKSVIEKLFNNPKIKLVMVDKAGTSRQDSVRSGLKAVSGECVFVHDGARPFIEVEKLEALHAKYLKKQGNYTLAVKVKDSIRKICGTEIIGGINREEIVAVQTPQIAISKQLREAHKKAEKDKISETDETGLLIKYGYKVELVEGSYHNIKITTKSDLCEGE